MTLSQAGFQTFHLLLGVFIVVLALIQSVFGVGLLIFGTPALLLIGMEFDRVLSVLLPASLSVSVLQIAFDGRARIDYVRSYFVYMLPALGLGLVATSLVRAPGIELVVCGFLIMAAALRVFPGYREKLMAFGRRFSRTMLVSIGVVHGMTNMGGSLLEAYVSSREADKLDIRQGIALGYALLVASQLLVLSSLGRFHITAATLVAVFTAAAVFLTAGRRTFGLIQQAQYTGFVSVLMVLAAAALIAKRALS